MLTTREGRCLVDDGEATDQMPYCDSFQESLYRSALLRASSFPALAPRDLGVNLGASQHFDIDRLVGALAYSFLDRLAEQLDYPILGYPTVLSA
jgi:hypothetical protein